jgi:diacylglycerol kinase
MTEQTATPATPEVMPEQEIEFKGRKLWVKMPTPEQLLVWRRTLKQLQNSDVTAGWNGEQAMKALERTRLIIDSVLIHVTDKEWLDDEMLAGTIGLRDSATIINDAVEAFVSAAEAEGNRETRRAAKKAAPATQARRKAT